MNTPRRSARRFFLWGAPVALAAVLAVVLGCARDEAHLDTAAAHLAAGDVRAAVAALVPLKDSPFSGPAVRGALAVARAVGGEATGLPVDAVIDTQRFPLAVLARQAFERGEFRAVLELDALAAAAGQPTDSVVRTAALIEAGRPPHVAPQGTDSVLARQVAHYLQTLDERAGRMAVRDRAGRLLGYLDDAGDFELAPGIPAAVVPRNVAGLVQRSGVEGAIRLSLDLELSLLAYETFGYYRGSIVLVEPSTGEVLAAVSDRRTFEQDDGTPAFDQQREPASISKLITTTAFRRTGHDPDDAIAGMRCRGHGRYAGELLYCPSIGGPLRSLDRALAMSCNYAFAELGVRAGRHQLLEELRRYGFDGDSDGDSDHAGWDFPSGHVVAPDGNDRQLADMAVGLEATEVTPLHAALIASVMANGGVMPEPTLLHATDGRLGLHPRELRRAAGRRVLPAAWVPEMVKAMEAVANRGTGRHIAPSNFPVAMKTGTASHPRYGFHVNYIGIGPMPDARLAFAVRVTNQPTSRKVRYAAQRLTRRLLNALARVAGERGWLDGSAEPLSPRTRPWTGPAQSVAP